MDDQERRDIDLEDILREFGENPVEQPKEEPKTEPKTEQTQRIDTDAIRAFLRGDETWKEETRRIDPVVPPAEKPPVKTDWAATQPIDPVQVPVQQTTSDTIRLGKLTDLAETVPEEPVRVWKPAEPVREEPFSDKWEPEYEQPMGEYVPPQPIQFQPRSRLQELKRKLVAGPEKRFYELSEVGVGKLQAAIFLSLLVVLISAASTVMYAMGQVQENRMRLMVFSQFFALLVSGLLCSFQLIEGFGDMMKKRFSLNSLLAVTFVICCLDGVMCLRDVRVPCCAAFSLMATMSLWSTYQRRNKEISQMDTLRKATHLDGLAACPNYLNGQTGFLRTEGQVEDFMFTYAQPGKPERALNWYSLVAMGLSMAIGVLAFCLRYPPEGVMGGVTAFLQVTAVCLLASVPATAFISQSRPAAILERRFHKLGTVLCGWQGVEGLSGPAVFPVQFDDLCPTENVRLNGMKFFGSYEPEFVITCTAAIISADGCGLAPLFTQLQESRNCRHYTAVELRHYENGGLGGTVAGAKVLIGSWAFMKEMKIQVPDTARIGYGVYVAIDGELAGVYAVSYEKSQSAAAGLATLTSYKKLSAMVVSHDFVLTPGFVKAKFGMKSKRFFIPEHELRDQLQQTELPKETPSLLISTKKGLAPLAYGVTGARVLRSTCRAGVALHMAGGLVGLAIMLVLVLLGALHLLTPANMFLYQLIWMLPALLITEWARAV